MKENIKLNIFENMYSKKIIQSTNLSSIIESIKKGDENSSLINAAREANNNNFTKKVEQLIPAVAYNCFYTGSKLAMALKGLTGIVCLSKSDMSDKQIKDFKELLRLYPYVIAAWTSLDGRGLTCLVKIEGITEENFKDCWHTINEDIGIEFDEDIAYVTYMAPMSYDPDIYYNAEAAPSLILREQISGTCDSMALELLKVQDDILLEECGRIVPEDYDYSNARIRYETELKDSVFGDAEYRIFPNGIPYYTINTYYKAREEKRASTMYHQAGKFLILNPEIEEEDFIEILWEMNRYQCVPKLPLWKISAIAKEQKEKHEAGELKIKPGIRKNVYKTRCRMTLKEKRQLNANTTNATKISKTMKDIQDVLVQLMATGNTILLNQIIKLSTRSKGTVISYWNKCFKKEVEAYNGSLAG